MCECKCEKMTKEELRTLLIQVLEEEVSRDKEGNSYYKFYSALYDSIKSTFIAILENETGASFWSGKIVEALSSAIATHNHQAKQKAEWQETDEY